ncbi:mitochondrial ornithine transporter 1-like isoform X2 [Centruroides sculpturatus]|uniref:mitochondrial ornithine transporter 1-like isoform X1 n=1 Tax=Centruroides sculpturatus TaxID=218467 RepID=UPI000C6E952C|nr:mitochondrial ornithine transporter 1-like isoform X1 [Centruroides sculpturatus]XP_023218090.1 mitochondrial ornithine transporter 1-like isoform X2 [Centruroides sculpturatus]
MTHNELRTHWFKEGVIALGAGVLYGLTNVAVGHPFDTIKTKMQAQSGFEKTGMVQTFTKVFKSQGIVGLYRGCIPPFIGSGIYRSSQFAIFEAAYTYLDNDIGKTEIPLTHGLQIRVIAGGLMAGATRAIIECPLEYAKIKRQVGHTWTFRKIYTGFGITLTRNFGLLTSFFIFIDSGRRHFSEQFQRPILGPFLVCGIAATMAWWTVWPLEYVKSQVQGNYGKDQSSIKRLRGIIFEKKGIFALYRGILPGSLRSFIANGMSMIVMSFAQRKFTELGLRN